MTDPIPPDARRMAALLDGRLDDDARQQLLGELAASDEALDAYADAAAVLAALEREGVIAPAGTAEDDVMAAAGDAPTRIPTPEQATPVVSMAEARARRRPEPRWRVSRWAALAAGIAVMVAAPALWWRARPAGEDGGAAGAPSYVALLAPTARGAGLPPAWDGTPWRTTRGAGDPLTPEARAVRVGARLTDLELAAAARDTAAVRAVAAEVAALLDEVPGGGAAAAAYRALGTSATAGTVDDTAAIGRARRDAALVAGDEGVALGLWLEAARVAAARRDAGFFRTAASRAALERARGSLAGREEAPGMADRITTAAAARPPAWDTLRGELAVLLAALGG